MASNQGGNYQGPWLWPLVQGVRSMIATAGSSSVLPTGPAKRHCTDYSPENVDSVASTEVEMDEFAFLWSLKNFSILNMSEEIRSPLFLGGPKGNHQWQLKVVPKRKSEGQDYFAVSLVLAAFGGTSNTSNRKLKARFQITILDAEGRPGKQAGSLTAHSCEFTNGMSRWGYNKLLLYSDLMEPTRRLVVDDTIKIHCRVCVEGELTSKIAKGCTVARAVSAEERKTLRKEQLVNDFGNLLKHSLMSDLTIISPQNVLHAHKALLAARSSVFATMFASTNLESLEILEFDDEVIKGMLEYIYTGKTALLADRAPELLHISEKYELRELKEECEQVVADSIRNENAAELLVLANIYKATYLKTKVVGFINGNKEEVRKTQSFKRMTQEHPQLFVDLYVAE